MLLDSVSKNYVYKGISLRLENRSFKNISCYYRIYQIINKMLGTNIM